MLALSATEIDIGKVEVGQRIKVMWRGANPGGHNEFDQRVVIDLGNHLELRPQYEGKKFITSYLVNARTGQVAVVLIDEASHRMVDKALKKARKLTEPVAFRMGKDWSKERK